MPRATLFRKHRIPPFALIFAQLASGLSWVLIFAMAWSGNLEDPFHQFAWVHVVVLGWLTMTALAILIHALPSFLDVEWPAERVSRAVLAAYALGVVALVYGFLHDARMLGAAGVILFLSISAYLAGAFATALRGVRGEPVRRAVARAFAITFTFLFATAAIGLFMTAVLSGWVTARSMERLPIAHAHLGTIGWTSLLIYGISRRTFRPITGAASRLRWVHIGVGSLGILGTLLLASGVNWPGVILLGLAALAYAFDTLDTLARATNPHRAPMAFILAAVLWLLTAVPIGCGILIGKPWQSAYMFVLLAGWAGQMVNAHLHHIGIRLIATMYRGDEDETPPKVLLEARLSWYTFLSFQGAIALVAIALANAQPGLAARGAIFGLTAWIAMCANVLVARIRAAATA